MDRSSADSSFIFLYGPPGSGKSSIGRELARCLALDFHDLDKMIEARAGKTVQEIFEQEGEADFRERERALLNEVLRQKPAVIALGGGCLLDPENRGRAEAAGPVLCLTAEQEALVARLSSSSTKRPLLAGKLSERLEDLLARRAAHYASFPLQLDTTQIPKEEVVWEAMRLFGRFYVTGMGSGYGVCVSGGALGWLGEALSRRGLQGKVAVVSDENVARFYRSQIEAALQSTGFFPAPVVIPAGEQHKTLETVASLWSSFVEAGLERGSPVVALGGGVVTDLAGFAAATFLRGVPWVAVPTSLLGMADASLGGKTGADLPQGKNLVGAFYPPRLVLADPLTLLTLPEGELRSGLAEVVKAGLIGDPQLFERCALGWAAIRQDWDWLVSRAMAVKIRVIQADPYEKGQRAALNLGHTLGHALEKVSAYQLRHGEAVAIGMAAAARLSEQLGLAEAGLTGRIERALQGLDLPVEIPPGLDRRAILEAMRVDKKRLQGSLRFVLPVRVGEVKIGVEVDDLDALFEKRAIS